jgi:hypothetical protein
MGYLRIGSGLEIGQSPGMDLRRENVEGGELLNFLENPRNVRNEKKYLAFLAFLGIHITSNFFYPNSF